MWPRPGGSFGGMLCRPASSVCSGFDGRGNPEGGNPEGGNPEVEVMSTTLEKPTIPMAGCTIRRAILNANAVRTPFRYWLLHDVLPAWLPEAVRALPFS